MLDLNRPEDARTYILTWIENGHLRVGRKSKPFKIEDGTDEDFLRVAYQLFVFCDDRPAAGDLRMPH